MTFLGSILKTAIHVATSPIEVAKDAVTMCGALTDQDEPYTLQRLKKLGSDLKEVEDAANDL